MIDENDFDEISDLPPDLAFVRLENKYRRAFEQRVQKTKTMSEQRGPVFEYMNHVITTAQALELSVANSWFLPDADSDDLFSQYREFIATVDRVKVKIQLLHARTGKDSKLSQPEKSKLRAYVEKIKTIIEESDVETNKRERLLNLINKFLAELDRDRTPFKTFSELMMGFAHLGGKMAEEAEPAWKWFRLIGEVLGAHQEEKRAQLPPPEKPKQIEDQSNKTKASK
ncbi:MAG: hypothetical protein Q7V17_11920 [Afipia sp.]|nr:hypothetical protein [Afipia sp.]